MIMLNYDKDDHVTAAAAGHRLDLMSELSILIGHALHKILQMCPDDKTAQALIAGIFECALKEKKRLDDGDNE